MQCLTSNYFFSIWDQPLFPTRFCRVQPGQQSAMTPNIQQHSIWVLVKMSAAGHKITLTHRHTNTAAGNVTTNNGSLNSCPGKG